MCRINVHNFLKSKNQYSSLFFFLNVPRHKSYEAIPLYIPPTLLLISDTNGTTLKEKGGEF